MKIVSFIIVTEKNGKGEIQRGISLLMNSNALKDVFLISLISWQHNTCTAPQCLVPPFQASLDSSPCSLVNTHSLFFLPACLSALHHVAECSLLGVSPLPRHSSISQVLPRNVGGVDAPGKHPAQQRVRREGKTAPTHCMVSFNLLLSYII